MKKNQSVNKEQRKEAQSKRGKEVFDAFFANHPELREKLAIEEDEKMVKNQKMNIFRIVISQTKDMNENTQPFGFYIETNAASKDEIESAYKAGVKIVGVDVQDILKDNPSPEFSEFLEPGYAQLLDAFEKIKPLAIEGDLDVSAAQKLMDYYGRKDFAKDADIDDAEEYENDVIVNTPEYYLLWRATVRLGNPDLIINETDINLDIDIGGHYQWLTS